MKEVKEEDALSVREFVQKTEAEIRFILHGTDQKLVARFDNLVKHYKVSIGRAFLMGSVLSGIAFLLLSQLF